MVVGVEERERKDDANLVGVIQLGPPRGSRVAGISISRSHLVSRSGQNSERRLFSAQSAQKETYTQRKILYTSLMDCEITSVKHRKRKR